MDFVSKLFFICDWLVGKIHSLIKFPWDELNRWIPFGLPNEGLGFPIMLGRIVFIGFLAAVAIMLIERPRRLHLFNRGKGFDPMSVYTLPVALSLWGAFLVFKKCFLGEDHLFGKEFFIELGGKFGLLFHGASTLESNLEILLAIVAMILALLALAVLLILPAIYFGSMREDYGRMTPLYFLVRLALYIAGSALLVIALYYAIKTGFAGYAIRAALLLIVGGWLLLTVFYVVVLLINILVMAIIRIVTPSAWKQSIAIVEEEVRKNGNSYGVIVEDHDGRTKTYWGKDAVHYVQNHRSSFKDIHDDPFK